MRFFIHPVTVLLFIGLFLSACSDNNDTDPIPVTGTFEVEFTGDWQDSESMNFTGFHLSTEDELGEIFVLTGASFDPDENPGETPGAYSISISRAGMVSATTYDVLNLLEDGAEEEFAAGNVAVIVNHNTDEGSTLTGASTGGSIDFQTASNDVVSGTFAIDVTLFDTGTETQLNATMIGEFESPRVDEFDPDNPF